MPLRKRIAITMPEWSFQVADCVRRACWAEERGFDDVWWGDFGAPDALTTTAFIAARTERIRLGVGVVPVYTRTPALIAATANALAQMLPGRFVLGLGSSSHTMVEGWHGVALEKPLSRVRDTAVMVRSMLAGERSAFDFEALKSRGYTQPPLEQAPPIYIAGLRPRMVEMAAEVGDGVVFNLWPRVALPKMMEHVRIGAERAGKKLAELEIVNRHQVCVTDEPEVARQEFRQQFAPYYATPVYNRFLAWAGFEGAAETITEGWAQRDRAKTTGALDDALVDEIAIIGTAEECHERIREAAEGGIHTHIIASLSQDPERVNATFEAFAPDRFSF